MREVIPDLLNGFRSLVSYKLGVGVYPDVSVCRPFGHGSPSRTTPHHKGAAETYGLDIRPLHDLMYGDLDTVLVAAI